MVWIFNNDRKEEKSVFRMVLYYEVTKRDVYTSVEYKTHETAVCRNSQIHNVTRERKKLDISLTNRHLKKEI
jgi:hypothetical protein